MTESWSGRGLWYLPTLQCCLPYSVYQIYLWGPAFHNYYDTNNIGNTTTTNNKFKEHLTRKNVYETMLSEKRTIYTVWSQFCKKTKNSPVFVISLYINKMPKENCQNVDSGSLLLNGLIMSDFNFILYSFLYSLNFLPWPYITFFFLNFLIWNISCTGKNVYDENV